MHPLLDLVGIILSVKPCNINSFSVLLHMLNLLEHYPIEERGGLNTHRMLEAMKFGFAARYVGLRSHYSEECLWKCNRTKISDPAFANQTQLIDEISTKEFANKVFANLTDVCITRISRSRYSDQSVKDRTHPPEYYQPVYDVKTDHGTVSL